MPPGREVLGGKRLFPVELVRDQVDGFIECKSWLAELRIDELAQGVYMSVFSIDFVPSDPLIDKIIQGFFVEIRENLLRRFF